MSKDLSVTNEQQVKFLEETIMKLTSFKQTVEEGILFVESAMMQDKHTAPTIGESGGHNIYISIDYQKYDKN